MFTIRRTTKAKCLSAQWLGNNIQEFTLLFPDCEFHISGECLTINNFRYIKNSQSICLNWWLTYNKKEDWHFADSPEEFVKCYDFEE